MTKGKAPKLSKIPGIKDLKKHVNDRKTKVKKLEKHDKKVEKKEGKSKKKKKPKHDFIQTEVPGFDDLSEYGLPKGAQILIAGGAGSGKTIFCLQTLYNAVKNGEKCLYLSFEEPVENLKKHMEDFGWDTDVVGKKGPLRIEYQDPFEIATAVEAMLAEAKGDLLIDIEEVVSLFPKDFNPDRICIDSISAVAAAFGAKEEKYRIYIEQLFKYLRKTDVTSFLISETEQIPTSYSRTGIEEFLADGVIVMYNIRQKDVRTTALEILKMRGADIKKKLVPFTIEGGKGIEVYPNETVFAEI